MLSDECKPSNYRLRLFKLVSSSCSSIPAQTNRGSCVLWEDVQYVGAAFGLPVEFKLIVHFEYRAAALGEFCLSIALSSYPKTREEIHGSEGMLATGLVAPTPARSQDQPSCSLRLR